MAEAAAVRVGVRVRPLTAKEHDERPAIVCHNERQLSLGGKSFAYDTVWPPQASQQQVFESIGPSLLDSFLQGYNATIIAYGQTGSGKTYTMGSEAHTQTSEGLIPRFVQTLFTRLSEEGISFSLTASFLEVYAEEIYDLLHADRPTIPLREDADGQVVCSHLTQVSIPSPEDAIQVLQKGTLHRTTASTLMNHASSRSHAVFTLTLTTPSTTSRLTFVDLAGSERLKKTGASGDRAKEGISINQGLLALGNVIHALSTQESHVPYRQSKLTRLLQQALGGNSQTLFLACVSPAESNANESLSTLRYAQRARHIQNAPILNNVTENNDTMVRVLQSELLRTKFGLDPDNVVQRGHVPDEWLQRQDVQTYWTELQSMAGSFRLISTTEPVKPPSPLITDGSSPDTSSLATVHDDDSSVLLKVDPEKDMAILDQLLELQQRDHEFGEAQKRDSAELVKVDGELAAQEALLLELKKNLAVYHELKDKYEGLMAEVHQLEAEKSALAEKLQQVNKDPSRGCSKTIKHELERVERKLQKAQTESKLNRQQYRALQNEVEKCRRLEDQIAQLKSGRAQLVKKQKEAASKHRAYTEEKTRELRQLQRKERQACTTVSKLQRQLNLHEKTLAKRHEYINKLSTKLQQTESHLMKLLSIRQKEWRDRSRRIERRHGRSVCVGNMSSNDEPVSDEHMRSTRFCVERALSDRVQHARIEAEYEQRIAEYSATMRDLRDAVLALSEARGTDEPPDLSHLQERVEERELKVDLAGSSLEALKEQIASFDKDRNEDDLQTLLSNQTSVVLRTLLLEALENQVNAQVECSVLQARLARKEAAISTYDNEVGTLSNCIESLNAKLKGRKHSEPDHGAELDMLKSELSASRVTLEQTQQALAAVKEEAATYKQRCRVAETDLASVKERLTCIEVVLQQADGVEVPESFLADIQCVWERIGTSPEDRERVRLDIENCFINTCNRLLDEARSLELSLSNECTALLTRLGSIQDVLDLDKSMIDSSLPLQDTVDMLRQEIAALEPSLVSHTTRRRDLRVAASELVASLGKSTEDLLEPLSSLLRSDDNTLSGETLSENFLASCEKAIGLMRVSKSEILLENSSLQAVCFSLIQDMNLSEDEAGQLVNRYLRRTRSMSELDEHAIRAVISSVMVERGVVRATDSFRIHLRSLNEAIQETASCRRALANLLRNTVEHAQKVLLEIVDGEVDVKQAYASFQESLARLPSLSREFMQACTAEINALVPGVDAMTQSEVEALTVVWEALQIDERTRSELWDEIEQSLISMEPGLLSPFDEVLRLCTADDDAWIRQTMDSVKPMFGRLRKRLFKLEAIHNEVEKLRLRQDTKSSIISLDSEVQVLNAKLAEFEEKNGDKDRLMSKKTGSLTLLKEEKFRRQMQIKFSAKLEQLAKLLKTWQASEGSSFDPYLLSEEVRMLLENEDAMKAWVEKRTGFMHLSLVSSTSRGKRSVRSKDTASNSPRKRRRVAPESSESSSSERKPRTRRGDSNLARQQKQNTSSQSLARAAENSEQTKSPKNVSAEDPRSPLRTRNSRRVANQKAKLALPPFGHVLESATKKYMK